MPLALSDIAAPHRAHAADMDVIVVDVVVLIEKANVIVAVVSRLHVVEHRVVDGQRVLRRVGEDVVLDDVGASGNLVSVCWGVLDVSH